jgi:amidophosphoribosyltransferase
MSSAPRSICRPEIGPDKLGPDKLREECGVFGIFGNDEAAAHTVLGLHALQHRGQEAAGVVTFDGRLFHNHRALGLVGDHFSSEAVISALPGHAAIGHVRYSTQGAPLLRNVQPLYADFVFGGLALAHNGNLTNALALRRQLVEEGCLFQSTSDTEVIIHLIARSRQPSVVERLVDALSQVEGAYALVALSGSALYGVRDPLGVRPLILGELDGAPILASESCALDIMGARFVRDIAPGEVFTATASGTESIMPFPPRAKRFCIFEYVYFARPDSAVEGQSVYETRKRIGAELAKEHPAPADLVIPVPDSGVPAAIGFAQAAGLPFELGLIRNHYVGRTFIEPSDRIRHLGVKLKHNANHATVTGRRVVLVDDSIVRGTTSTKIVAMIRQAGATEVHMRVASPPTTHSCFYGVDTPERSELLAAQNDLEAMARIIGVDSLAFLSLDGLYRAVGGTRRDARQPLFCDACFSGDYPTQLEDLGKGGSADQLSLMLEDA